MPAHLVVRASDGRHRAGSGTVTLARGYAAGVREAALPVLRPTAEQPGATVALVAAEGDEAVAVTVTEPLFANYLLSYRVGSRNPVGVGAAGPALAALRPPGPDESPEVTRARAEGYARTMAGSNRARTASPCRCTWSTRRCTCASHLISWREDVARRLPADDAGGRRGDLGPGLIPHRRRPGSTRCGAGKSALDAAPAGIPGTGPGG
ncbi:hypothetical protein ABZ114_16295 [Streptomyces albidoflavus]|uniref:hypothetical protein n=1 Tax=Streptomyces TaxID=1883 RepID=UPI00069D9539|nr:hypothetical protein [Streptomyces sp. KE1]